MSNDHITYLVAAGCAVIGLVAFAVLVVAPAVSAYQRIWERAIALVLSLYVLAAFVVVGLVAGWQLVVYWPRVF
jgi:hypothetical protein